MGWFDLPNNWVYVIYEDGTKRNVMNTDTFTWDDINYCLNHYKDESRGDIVRIEFRNSRDALIKGVDV
jgi:hypothetical protein